MSGCQVYRLKGQFKDEFVTAGGVPLSEILNVDGVTGGFNFQMAATFEERARVAVEQAVQEALREANECAQLEQERAANFERQLKETANSIALMQSQNRRAPSHEDYLNEESDESD